MFPRVHECGTPADLCGPSCTNIQSHLSNYISDAFLNSSEFTVWDRPWAPNEEVRAGCCNPSTDRHELGRLRYAGEPLAERAGRNPIKQIEQRGGGLFELDWRERAKLLRQLVDWQRESSFPDGADGSRTIRPYSIDHKSYQQGRRVSRQQDSACACRLRHHHRAPRPGSQ